MCVVVTNLFESLQLYIFDNGQHELLCIRTLVRIVFVFFFVFTYPLSWIRLQVRSHKWSKTNCLVLCFLIGLHHLAQQYLVLQIPNFHVMMHSKDFTAI